jgi:hypothetical protein
VHSPQPKCGRIRQRSRGADRERIISLKSDAPIARPDGLQEATRPRYEIGRALGRGSIGAVAFMPPVFCCNGTIHQA